MYVTPNEYDCRYIKSLYKLVIKKDEKEIYEKFATHCKTVLQALTSKPKPVPKIGCSLYGCICCTRDCEYRINTILAIKKYLCVVEGKLRLKMK